MDNLLPKANVFMVVPLIIIYLLFVMNPSARRDSLIQVLPSCILFPTDTWKPVRGRYCFSLIPPSFCYLGGMKKKIQISCIIKITKCMAISYFRDPGLKGELEEIVGRNCYRTMDRVKQAVHYDWRKDLLRNTSYLKEGSFSRISAMILLSSGNSWGIPFG